MAKVFGLINNLKNESKGDDIWIDTSKSELKLILKGLADLENGRTIAHNVMMNKLRDKVANA